MDNHHELKNIDALFSYSIPLWKRLMDIFGSLFGLICLAPFFFLIACLIKLTSRGPVFYNPLRAGLGGKPFHLYKFRTMIDGADSLREKLIVYNERSGPVFKMTNDPRVTSIGNFLRMWSLDELPQLINVLKGDMSLVGPRPLDIVEEKSMNDWHRIRRTVKPGMTCLWQISDRKNPDFDEWVRLDIRYVKKLSFWMDIKILFFTIPSVIKHKNI